MGMYCSGNGRLTMQHYFFHIRAGGKFIPDDEGMELFSLEAAHAELRASAEDLASTAHGGTVEMQDEEGRVVASMIITRVLH